MRTRHLGTILAIAAILLAGFSLSAESAEPTPVLTFTASTTTGNGTVTPVLTWSTTPAAASCTASGAWTGTRAASGTVTLASISQSATYNLECTWPADDRATLQWQAPTQNTDGTPYNDPAGYKVYWGSQAAALNQTRTIADPATLTYVVQPLAAGTWYFCVAAVNQRGVESACSAIGSKTMVPTAVQRTVGITVNPVPRAPQNLTVQ